MINKKNACQGGNPNGRHKNNLDNYTAKAKLLSILYEGKKTRAELSMRMHLTDREVRELIEELRNESYPICSSSAKSGYWIGSKTDLERTVKEYRARGLKHLKTAIALEMCLEKMPGQMEVDDVLV